MGLFNKIVFRIQYLIICLFAFGSHMMALGDLLAVVVGLISSSFLYITLYIKSLELLTYQMI